jgi:photosystem II stability/assembly factor-like uncharacterized protein
MNLFAGTQGGHVFLSSNNGTSWSNADSGLANTDVWSLAVSGINLFAGTYGSGVYLSTDDGTSWNDVDSGLTNAKVVSLDVSGTNLFAGTYGGGAFLSTNNGKSWSNVDLGLTNLNVVSFASDGGSLFAGTWYGGVWKRALSEMITDESQEVQDVPERLSLSQNYPNPFNPSTVIAYQLPTNNFVTLKIFDVLGREIASLVNERQTAGSHSVTFSANGLPSGVYFYRLQAGNYTETRKLVLLK